VTAARAPARRAQPWAKEWRAVAMRHDKTPTSFLGGMHLAAAFVWLSSARPG
jgi:transposase